MIQGESFNNVAVAENIPHNQNKNLSLVCHCLPQSTTHRGPKPSHIGHSMLHNYFFKRKKKNETKTKHLYTGSYLLTTISNYSNWII